MKQCTLRFQCLVLHEEADASAIYFEVEDDYAITQARATIRSKASGTIEVESPVTRATFDVDVFVLIVKRIYAEQVEMLERFGEPVLLGPCVMALESFPIKINEHAA